MTETVNYPLPTVHLNGTDKRTLLWGNIKIQKALSDLSDALNDCTFHGRDYYVQDNDPAMDAFHDGYLRQTALKCHSSILTVDSCTPWHWDGNVLKIDKVMTSSESGFIDPLGNLNV